MSEIHSFTSRSLLLEESKLQSLFIDTMDALIIGEIAKSFGLLRALPIAIEVRIGNCIITMPPYRDQQLKIKTGLIARLEL